jgi:hypothetical protein
MSEFDDKPLPAGEITDNSDNDTEVRVSSPDEATNSNRTPSDINDDKDTSTRVDPPPSRNGSPSIESSSKGATKKAKDVKSDMANGTAVEEVSVTENSPTESQQQAQSDYLLEGLTDINPSATDTSILSIDPDGLCPSHRHKASMIFTDDELDDVVVDDVVVDDVVDYYTPRESVGGEVRSPSPLSDGGNEAEEQQRQQADGQVEKPQSMSASGDFQTSQTDEGEEKEKTDRPSPLHTNAADPFAGVHPHFFQESQSLSQSQEADAHMQAAQLFGSPLLDHRDSGLPHMIYQRPGQQYIPHMPALVVPNVHRTNAPPPRNDYPNHQLQGMPAMGQGQMMVGGGKRKIHLRLLEDVPPQGRKQVSFLGFSRKKKGNPLSPMLNTPRGQIDEQNKEELIDRGRVTVSWYDGTSSLELHEHVRNSVIRKIGLNRTEKLSDLRILDEAFDPPEGTYSIEDFESFLQNSVS